MTLYLSAGHSLQDSGAVGINGRTENKETIRLRNAVLYCLQQKHMEVITDKDSETLAAYLARVQPSPDDVVLELHFNAFDGKASGTECLVKNKAGSRCVAFAQKLVNTVSRTLGISDRGVKPESESGRHYLALVHAAPVAVILETCFIDNATDMDCYDRLFEKLVVQIADILSGTVIE